MSSTPRPSALARVALLPLMIGTIAHCGSHHSAGFMSSAPAPGEDGAAPVEDASVAYATDDASTDASVTVISVPDVQVPDVMQIYQAYDGALVNAPGGCKPGHYEGTFTGIYSSYLTVAGVPIPVAGDVSLTLDESSNGEFYTISNGTVNGTADYAFPYFCQIVGTLNCKTKKIENGGLRNCSYCVGFGGTPDASVSLTDGGGLVCAGIEGHFNGPLTADYDSSIHAFVNGAWAGSESVEAGAPTDAGGGCKAGPVEYGGCGNWSAQYAP
jgi:hypothetical protein